MAGCRGRGRPAGIRSGPNRAIQPAAHPAADVLHRPFDEQVRQRAERDHDGQRSPRPAAPAAGTGGAGASREVVVDLDDQRVQQVDGVADQAEPGQRPRPPDVPERQPGRERQAGQQQRGEPAARPEQLGVRATCPRRGCATGRRRWRAPARPPRSRWPCATSTGPVRPGRTSVPVNIRARIDSASHGQSQLPLKASSAIATTAASRRAEQPRHAAQHDREGQPGQHGQVRHERDQARAWPRCG